MNDDDIVISVTNISKSYRIWENPAARLTAPLLESAAHLMPGGGAPARWLRSHATSRFRDFHALQDISFEVRRGQAVGIIGRNGSGKSTLLQIISGTLQATAGSVAVKGRVAALLELGSGFNPEFTGRENVYLNGAVLGLSREEMDQRFDDIAAFADIGEFIHEPVRTYSSGMVVRLAFAVAAHVDPAILIVDEALSVGDARFQLKCARAIDRFIERGVTLLFVSHDSSMVKRLCNRAILLEGGRSLYAGIPNDVVNLYSKLMADGGSAKSIAPDIAALQAGTTTAEPATASPSSATSHIGLALQPVAPVEPEAAGLRRRLKAMETVWASHPGQPELERRFRELLKNERQHVQISGEEFAYGGDLGRITEVRVHDRDGEPRTWFTSGEAVTVRMQATASDHFSEPIFALTIKNTAGVEVYGTNTFFSKQPAAAMFPGSCVEIDFFFPLDVMPGHYFLSFGFTHFVGEELVVIHRRYDALKLEVHGKDRSFGIANLHAKITVRVVPPEAAP
jgi:lipopolysaccharide transport system ATP-binding protein